MTLGTPLVRSDPMANNAAREKNKLKANLLSPSEKPPEREQLEFRYSEQ
jgi:hypothetical protein